MAKITQKVDIQYNLSKEFFIGKQTGSLYRRSEHNYFINLFNGEIVTDKDGVKPCVIGEVYQLEVDK